MLSLNQLRHGKSPILVLLLPTPSVTMVANLLMSLTPSVTADINHDEVIAQIKTVIFFSLHLTKMTNSFGKRRFTQTSFFKRATQASRWSPNTTTTWRPLCSLAPAQYLTMKNKTNPITIKRTGLFRDLTFPPKEGKRNPKGP